MKRVSGEMALLATMSDRELVAYWNILQFPVIIVGDDGKNERHLGIVDELLTLREIPHERGRRTIHVGAHALEVDGETLEVEAYSKLVPEGTWV
jgi:hypothetical protein